MEKEKKSEMERRNRMEMEREMKEFKRKIKERKLYDSRAEKEIIGIESRMEKRRMKELSRTVSPGTGSLHRI